MEEANWLSLLEYSTKHNVSISTLRRRIRDQSINFKLDNGRYYIVDHLIEKAPKGRRPITFKPMPAPAKEFQIKTPETKVQETKSQVAQEQVSQETVAPNAALGELKKAYFAALQSKEELIFQLKEEVSDLKTLVRVLEAEVERLKSTTLNLY